LSAACVINLPDVMKHPVKDASHRSKGP
jgi:hypothetical protein